MSQRTRKQKDSDLLAKEEQTSCTRNEGGNGGFRVADISYPDAGANMARNPGTGQPTVAPTPQDVDSDSKESKDEFENGFVDAPGGSGNASSLEADAKRDASPDQRTDLAKQARSQGTQ